MKSLRVVAVLAAVLVTSSVAFAQEPKTAKPAGDPKAAKPAAAPAAQDAKAAAMQAPTPAPETKKLAFMAGNFTSDEHFFANAMMPETRSKGTIEGKFVLGDFFLATEVKSEAMG